MLKKLALLRCERTAKISHLFQSCKHFFKNFAFFEKFVFSKGRNLVHRERNPVRNDSDTLLKNLFFSNAVAKVATFLELANILSTFFKKSFFGRIKTTNKWILPILYRSLGFVLFYVFSSRCRSILIHFFGACQNHSSSVVMTSALV